jgi:hypothetical protein
MERIILQAPAGKILTNGEIYGRILYLADGIDPSTFYEITEEEYQAQIATERIDILE